jgi:high-affinity iron transporter
MARVLLLLVASWFAPLQAATDPGELLQLIDYLAVDYPEAVRDGVVVHDGEYAEMREFAGRSAALTRALPEHATRAELIAAADRLIDLVETRAPVEQVRAVSTALRSGLLGAYPLATTPIAPPDLDQARALYAQHCASCHGATGDGQGPAAVGLEPPPTAFTDAARARERSLFGLYSTVTRGVAGTAMPAFPTLTDRERWSLAFHIGSLHLAAHDVDAGRSAPATALPTLAAFSTATPMELESAGHARSQIAALRADPSPLFARGDAPLVVARTRLAEAGAAYAAGDAPTATRLALSAYLDGFELAEAALSATDHALLLDTEAAMLAVRLAMDAGAGTGIVNERIAAADALLERAAGRVGSGQVSGSVAFVSSFVILLREGLEAILIVGAIGAFMSRTGHREALAWLHGGWVAALLAGFATWGVATWILTIGGATRELTEGFTALLAAVVLFWVGFWMHGQLDARRWQRFLQERIQMAIDRRALWGIAGISFVAVYREVFETILFYQALWMETEGGAESAILAGGGAALVALGAVAFAVFRYGMRLPLRQFFGISATLMLVLAVVFAGKGIAALQEAGRLPIDPVSFPRIELLGIYPNLQGLLVQLALVTAAIAFVVYNRRAAAAG